MKLILTEPGFTKFNGQFGSVDFIDGKSARDITPVEANRISSLIRAKMEDDTNPSISQAVLESRTTPMTVAVKVETPAVSAEQAPAPVAAPVLAVVVVDPAAVKKYSKEELEAIADKEGITGLRVVGDTVKVKGVSIVKMIRDIMNAQGTPMPTEFPKASA